MAVVGDLDARAGRCRPRRAAGRGPRGRRAAWGTPRRRRPQLDEDRGHPAVAGGVADVVLARGLGGGVDDELAGGRVVGRGGVHRLDVGAVAGLGHARSSRAATGPSPRAGSGRAARRCRAPGSRRRTGPTARPLLTCSDRSAKASISKETTEPPMSPCPPYGVGEAVHRRGRRPRAARASPRTRCRWVSTSIAAVDAQRPRSRDGRGSRRAARASGRRAVAHRVDRAPVTSEGEGGTDSGAAIGKASSYEVTDE